MIPFAPKFMQPFGGSKRGIAYLTEVLADNPLAYWRLGESSGTTAVDEVGSYDGTYYGSPTLGVAGAVAGNTAVDFDNVAKNVIITTPNISGDITLECWVNPHNIVNTSYVSRGSDDYSGWGAVLGGFSDGFVFAVVINDTYYGTSPYAVAMNTWYHVVGVRNGTTISLYINGSQVATASCPSSILRGPGFPYYISRPGAASTIHANAVMDEVAIYNYALTPARIAAHYAARNNP